MIEFIDEAEKIRTNGRWKKLNNEIVRFSKSIPKKEEWKLDVFPNLAFNILNEYTMMKSAFIQGNNDSPIVVWHARNLLELSVWVLFCLQSDENERWLYEESGVDAFDLLSQSKKAFAGDDDMLQNFNESIEKLTLASKARGVQDIDRKFSNIGKVASNLGLKEQFQFEYKFLSKYAHATAMQIVSPHMYQSAKELAFGFGCKSFVNAFHCLESYFINVSAQDYY